MARPTNFDVWFVAADTVYRGVPYDVLSGWVGQGRVGKSDKLRPAGSNSPWASVADHPLLADFLAPANASPHSDDLAEQLAAVELDEHFPRPAEEEDDDVDMIPLIDISLVLLIFFMMTAAVASLSPVDVPGLKNAGPIHDEANSMTVRIEKRANGDVIYSLQQGTASPAPEDNNLASVSEVMARLDARLTERTTPPSVRVACDKALPRERMREVAKELDARRVKEQISAYVAEVNENK